MLFFFLLAFNKLFGLATPLSVVNPRPLISMNFDFERNLQVCETSDLVTPLSVYS